MEEIEVAAPNEEAAIFPCRCWLAEDEGDGKTARVLQPGETVSPPSYDSKYTCIERFCFATACGWLKKKSRATFSTNQK